MTPETLMLYHSPTSPNSRRVRIFLIEKDLKVPLVAVDLGKGEQHSEAYRAVNPRRVVPTLVLEDGTAVGEVPAIMRCLDEAFPDKPLLGATRDRRETGGVRVSSVFSRLFSDRGWGRGMDFKVGENWRRSRGSRHGPHRDQEA